MKADLDQEDKDRRREMSQMRAEAYKHIKLQRQLEEVSQKEALENAKIQYEMGAHVSWKCTVFLLLKLPRVAPSF